MPGTISGELVVKYLPIPYIVAVLATSAVIFAGGSSKGPAPNERVAHGFQAMQLPIMAEGESVPLVPTR